MNGKSRFWIDDAFIDSYGPLCGATAIAVYGVLCRHADKYQTCFPSKKLIALEIGMSERAVFTAIKKLKKYNIIHTEKLLRTKSGRWGHLTYTLKDKTEWWSGSMGQDFKKEDDAANLQLIKPTANNATNQQQVLPTKDSHINKETHIGHLPPSPLVGSSREDVMNKQPQVLDSELVSSSNSLSVAFNSASYIQALIDDEDRATHLVGVYFSCRDFSFPSKSAAERMKKKQLKIANRIINAGWSFQQISATLNFLCCDRFWLDKWTLHNLEAQLPAAEELIKSNLMQGYRS